MGAGASVGGYQDTIDACVSVLKDKDQIKDLWSEIDFNGNGYVSLAEIDKVGMFRECVGCWDVSLYKLYSRNIYFLQAHVLCYVNRW